MKKLLIPALALVLQFTAAASASEPGYAGLDDLGGKTALLSARCICQDEDGAIWFGTDKCLYSYDGYKVTAHPDGLGHIQINTIINAGKYVVMGTNDGLFVYDSDADSYSEIKYFENDGIRSMILHGDVLFVGAKSGLYAYKWKDIDGKESVSRLCTEEIFTLEEGKERIWVGTVGGLGKYTFETNAYIRLKPELYSNRDAHSFVAAIHEENDSTLWVGTPSYLVKCDPRDLSTSIAATVPVLKDICETDDGCFYLCTDSGILKYSQGTTEKIKDITAYACFSDRKGDLWFATDGGLLLSEQNRVLKTVDTSGCPEGAIHSTLLKDSRGRLWAAGSSGIALFADDGAGSYVFEKRFSMEGTVNHIPHNKVKKMVEDKADGTIYAATDRGYLKYDEGKGQFDSFNVTGTYNWFYDIILDGNKMWIASFDGLICLEHGKFKRIYTSGDGLSSNDISQIAKDRSGAVWLLTRDQNVYSLEPKSGDLALFDLEKWCGTPHAECLTSDIEGTIWICAKNSAVHVNNFSTEDKVTVKTIDSIKSMEVYSVQDLDSRLWICSSEGVYIMDKRSGESSHINTGTQYVSACYDEMQEKMILGASGLISCFDVADTPKLSGGSDSPVRVTSITVNSRETLPLDLIRSGKVTLSSKQNSLNISFSDYNYGSDIPARFNFSLDGRGSGWSEVVSGNSIVIPDMKPGRYSLFITSGKTTGKTASVLDITIRQPWYFSFPMILLYLLITAALVWWVLRFLTIKKYLELEREQRDTLLAQSKEKEAFFGNIAHEFKTPLSMIIAPLSKYINDSPGAEGNEMLKVALENANKLNALTRNTIDYYRDKPSAGSDLILSEVEMVEYARAILLSFKEGFPKDEFIFDSSETEIYTDIDVVKMEAVLSNLISNACKYTPEGGSVILTLERDKERNLLVIKVSDTGIGIPQDELGLVFQRYYESSRSKAGNYDSTGIGLAMVKKNVESHKGTVDVSSDDNGTTFTVVLPCKEARQSTRQDGAILTGDKSDKPLIVIVEDNAQVCGFLSQLFKDKYRCISSGNGKSGLKLCKDVMPDLIISDVMMPVMDGLEMCRQIREYAPLATIPIILLTAKSDSETEKRSIALGIDSFMPKPFDFATLAGRVDQLLANKQRMEQKLRLEMLSKPEDKHELSYDEKYLKKVTDLIEEHIDDSDLSVAKLCEYGDFNDKQLYRKIKQFTGLSTVEYIRSIRLKKAAILLQNGNFTISEVMYSVGFSNASYFTRAFSAEYGKTPTDYMRSYKK